MSQHGPDKGLAQNRWQEFTLINDDQSIAAYMRYQAWVSYQKTITYFCFKSMGPNNADASSPLCYDPDMRSHCVYVRCVMFVLICLAPVT